MHDPFGPSSLGRIRLCPGSYVQSKKAPPTESSSDAAEGTTMHNFMEAGLKLPTPDQVNYASDLAQELTEEQMETLNRCMKYAREKLNGYRVWTERFMVLEANLGEAITGTADVVAINQTADHAIGIDWKFGRGSLSQTTTLMQAAAYACMIFQTHPDVKVVDYFIYQPRVGFGGTEYAASWDVQDYVRLMQMITESVRKAQELGASLNPSPAACQFCPAISVCPAAAEVTEQLPVEYESGLPVEPAKIAKALDMAKIVKKQVKAVEGLARQIMKEGGEIPGYILKPRQGSKRLADVPAAMDRLGELCKFDDFLSVANIPLRKLLKIIIDREAAKEGTTKKAQEKRLFELLGDTVSQSDPTFIITKED
jgi:hypothetical protein